MELNLTINVLGVYEDDAWCAIALEMSLRGYGVTFDEALEELHRTIEAQVSFAVQHDTVDQIFIPAEPHYFRLYADSGCTRIQAVRGHEAGGVEAQAP